MVPRCRRTGCSRLRRLLDCCSSDHRLKPVPLEEGSSVPPGLTDVFGLRAQDFALGYFRGVPFGTQGAGKARLRKGRRSKGHRYVKTEKTGTAVPCPYGG